MIDPYAALGLRRNPFTAEPQAGVAAALWLERGAPPAPQPWRRSFTQVLGEKGAGKTSLLLRWREQTGGPYHYVPATPARWRPPPIAGLAYWDEVDRMPWPVRATALALAARRGASLAVGTHRDLAALARRCGFAVATVQFAPLDVAAVAAWAALRIQAARLPGEPCALALPAHEAAAVAARAGHSWRVAADRLHMWAAEQARLAARGCSA